MKAIDKILKILTAIFEWLTGLLLVAMVAVITWLVFSRWILHRPCSWGNEVAVAMLIWFSLIGATFGVRERYHLRIDMLYKYFPRWVRAFITYAIAALIVLFGVLIFIGGAQHVALTINYYQTLPVTKAPAALLFLPLPIAGALIILYGLRELCGGASSDIDVPEDICEEKPAATKG